MEPIYLDHAAATPIAPEVLSVMQPYFTEKFYNPSALYWSAHQVAADIDSARRTVAAVFGVRPVEIIFTAGGTEANNLAVAGVLQAFPGSKVVVSAIEHDSVLEPARKYDHAVIPVSPEGIVELEALKGLVDDDTVLVSVMYANNEIGAIQPIREIAALVNEIQNDRRNRGVALPLYVHTDAAQAGNYLDMHASRLGVDLMTINGGKLYGPKQSGALYVRAGVQLRPQIRGGGQEHNMRSGTENVAAVIGLAEALRISQKMRRDEVRRLQELQQRFFVGLTGISDDIVINGSLRKRLPNNVHATFPGQDNERLVMALDQQGVMAAAGSACSASKEESSHVLLALGMPDDAARASLRFTMGRQTTAADIDRTLSILTRLLV